MNSSSFRRLRVSATGSFKKGQIGGKRLACAMDRRVRELLWLASVIGAESSSLSSYPIFRVASWSASSRCSRKACSGSVLVRCQSLSFSFRSGKSSPAACRDCASESSDVPRRSYPRVVQPGLESRMVGASRLVIAIL
jgi:hypothetical protein